MTGHPGPVAAGTGDEVPAVSDRRYWDGFMRGLESGVRSGYDNGYTDADHNLQDTILGFLKAHPMRELIRQMDARAALEAALARPVDQRSGPELIRDARLSWGLPPPHELAAEDAAHVEADGLDDAASF